MKVSRPFGGSRGLCEANTHLDDVYGGYCVFAQVADDASFLVVDAIAKKVQEPLRSRERASRCRMGPERPEISRKRGSGVVNDPVDLRFTGERARSTCFLYCVLVRRSSNERRVHPAQAKKFSPQVHSPPTYRYGKRKMI